MDWQPTLSWQHAEIRATLIQQLRMFFYQRNVVEVETPLLCSGTVTDSNLDTFDTRYNYFPNSPLNISACLYLQTSPEYSMKRLLASGYKDIFQISKAFRHEDHGRYHNPEFTLLEWYRLGFSHFELMDEISELLKVTLRCEQPRKFSYSDIFKITLKIDPLNTTRDKLFEVIKLNNIHSEWLDNENDIDVILQFIFAELIEPVIGIEQPCFIYDFPSSQASLAKISNKDSRVAERFECYFKGIELANGFNELTDVKEQKKRFEEDNLKRKMNGKKIKNIDTAFINALDFGLPQCSGVALGIDRLMMLLISATSIDEVITFPIDRA